MSESLSFQYRFHPAGQGVFASGTVEGDNVPTPFHWVFDCGSTNTTLLRPEVERHRDLILGHDRLDLLCLSHFDRDYVSGLSNLLDGLHVGTVVMPYYTPVERLRLGLKYRVDRADYFDFLGNPVAYLLERAGSIDRIVLVGGPPQDGPEGLTVNDRPPQDDDDERERNRRGEEDWPFKPTDPESIRVEDGQIVDETTHELARRLDTEILQAPQSFRAVAHNRLSADWEFLFFHKPIDPAVVSQLRAKLDPVFQSPVYRRRVSDLTKALKNKAARRRIKKIFEDTLKSAGLDPKEDINSTSLCVYGGPELDQKPEVQIGDPFPHALIGGNHPRPCPGCDWYGLHGSILYTGDADLSLPANRNELRDFLNEPRWERIAVLQVPHHGSRNNWETGASAEFHHYWSVFCADEHHRRFQHPHREVLLDLMNRGPLLANKHQGWNWRGHVWFP